MHNRPGSSSSSAAPHREQPLLWVAIAAALGLSLVGCFGRAVDTEPALRALHDTQNRVAHAVSQRAEESAAMAEALMEIAAQRRRLALLLSLEELATQGDALDATTFERLLRDGSANALVQEVRRGHLTTVQALDLVRDFTAVRRLSPSLRRSAEEHLLDRLTQWREFAAAHERFIAARRSRDAHLQRLVAEAQALTAAIRDAAHRSRMQHISLITLAEDAADLIEDEPLRDSAHDLIDLLLSPDAAPTNQPDHWSFDE